MTSEKLHRRDSIEIRANFAKTAIAGCGYMYICFEMSSSLSCVIEPHGAPRGGLKITNVTGAGSIEDHLQVERICTNTVCGQ